MLLPAAEAFVNPCLPTWWTTAYEAWAYFFVTLAVLVMHLVDYLIKVGRSGAGRDWRAGEAGQGRAGQGRTGGVGRAGQGRVGGGGAGCNWQLYRTNWVCAACDSQHHEPPLTHSTPKPALACAAGPLPGG